ncbi:binding-protein-dependent transport system inner membrane protein [Thermincola ferriacetica]|uniref:Binding-protein-dependent transport systems inner membrane component n=2 Tax=Thermincola TaxID=278993 RepID=D5X9X8_THEPJ|nr:MULTISPECIES: methionine ABC transporter permease [Thermincola]ADG83111.1 binding-protein-dependent transport systems inner membrane component [Thermincola potens JR]KNZ70599.1 binding-protein-dependent transport system inner membrane protein [Thermincola ferriacetica]
MPAETWQLIYNGTLETLYMTTVSLILSYLVGLPLGIALVTTEEGHILENRPVNQVLSAVVNAARSVPFIILMVAVIPITRAITGTTIGTTAAIVPLVIGAIPFVGRMVETSLKEVDRGIVEAALAMGASPWQIIYKVLIPEVIPSLVLGATITFITLIGYSAMAGFIGGGGLGDIAVRYGYYRYKTDIMIYTVFLLLVMVQLIQSLGNYASRKLNKKVK